MATGTMGTLMCVFPAWLYHKNSTRRPWFELVKNTAEMAKDREAGCGWDLNLPVNARMGYREELEQGIHAFARTYMIYPSGLTNFNPSDTVGRYTARRFLPGLPIPNGVTCTKRIRENGCVTMRRAFPISIPNRLRWWPLRCMRV